ncbi:hypothetical protein SARC_05143 [Sphaeroforma arctica JP610]|uniref:Uncharacterized protein n=1 Tax=Sphaeroforma arctica JP610 TaxID=667725 RepID=A0A0L0G181_9EUKA|nr:hypothetical protein SARC_05143 [Sphaeroforma arctica JP610]KNC82569.1 hypothetical protein SARC_05143 [Sphaeroforma arctica JP610]|eukprot:XP_014156471.1 hypothetical protein SARC_05143 [Sphaeroforma arctica JP610]
MPTAINFMYRCNFSFTLFKKLVSKHGHKNTENFQVEDEEFFNEHAHTIEKTDTKLNGNKLAYKYAGSRALQEEKLAEWKHKLAATQLATDEEDAKASLSDRKF